MKRLLIALAISLFSASAFALAVDRDVLVTPDGTVFTVEQQTPSDSAGVAATRAPSAPSLSALSRLRLYTVT